jgi:hypothetical protein
MLRIAIVGFLAFGSAYAAPCDRAYLKATLGFRQTENAMVRRSGTGVWQSAKAPGKLQRRYFDPASEQAGYFGLIEDTNGPAILVSG